MRSRITSPLDSLKALCNRQAHALRKAEEKIASLDAALAVERAAKVRAQERASAIVGELDALRCRHGYPDPGDYNDRQPDEAQEWRDYDPDC